MTPATASNTPDLKSPVGSPGRIIYNGLDPTLDQGTGIASYTRLLTRIARALGYDVGVIYGTAFTPDTDPLLQEVLFFDQMRALDQVDGRTTLSGTLNTIINQVRYNFMVKPLPLGFGDAVIYRQYADSLAEHDRAYVSCDLFENANTFFNHTTRFINLSFDPAPDLAHFTCPEPLRVGSALNIYTIHDLSILQKPVKTPENQKKTFKLLKKIADTADHIVTVSETSKRDIIHILKVDENRVTNTYQAVALPQKYLERSEQAVANYLDGFYGLEMHGYLLFYGALEPKTNVDRLIEAFLSSEVDVPLVLVTALGRHDPDELNGLSEHGEQQARVGVRNAAGAQIRYLSYVGLSAHVSLIRGARAVVFPQAYGGFALPVLEAMMLGTPVITATSEALIEISGDAVLLVDPDDVDDVARALAAIVNDAGLRSELSRRGREQAAEFSVARYRERLRSLYASLA
jgi:glycosyltransferase involved in cell wall biosynthesis